MAIYDEAVIDAQKLREVAENAAKQQILEAITPRIRSLVNARIMQEQDEGDEDEDEDMDDVDSSGDLGDIVSPSAPVAPVAPVAPAPAPAGDKSPTVVINNTGDIHIDSDDDDDADGTTVITDQMAESLARMIRSERKSTEMKRRIDNLTKNFQLFKEAAERLVKSGKVTPGQKRKVSDTYRTLAREAVSLRREVMAEGGGSQRLEGKLVETLKEMRTMSTKTKRNIFDFLFEGDDEGKKAKKDEQKGHEDEGLEEAELSLSLDDDEKSQLADKGEDEIDDALMSVLGDVHFDLGDDEDEDAGADEDAGDEDAGDEAGDEGGDDLDLGEMDEMGMHEQEEDEGDMEEAVYEIDEAALRQELGKMRRLRESRTKRAKVIREQADTQIDQFGGAEEVGEVFYDVDEASLINVLADELGSVTKKPTPPGGNVKAEGRLRAALKEAAEYKKAVETLKGQLVEMNLFNAKLLYANKLMQNKDLTVKQQRAIVEALDNAKTLRETKLLYKSLTESLEKRSQKAGSLREGTQRTVLGSSSRSTRSAQPASSGVEVDRWAVLAGISGEK